MTRTQGNNDRQKCCLGLARWACLVLVLLLPAACSSQVEPTTSAALPQHDPPPTMPISFVTDDRVSLRESTVNWETYRYDMNEQFGIVDGSYDGTRIRQLSFQTWILENRYLMCLCLKVNCLLKPIAEATVMTARQRGKRAPCFRLRPAAGQLNEGFQVDD